MGLLFATGNNVEEPAPPTSEVPVVFIVDADPAVRDGIAAMVKTLGARPLCFESAEACLEQMNGFVPACLITEASLPGMDAIELLKHLRAMGYSTPTIFLALEGSVSAAVRAIQSGAVDYIEKPFIDRQLASRIRELCNLP